MGFAWCTLNVLHFFEALLAPSPFICLCFTVVNMEPDVPLSVAEIVRHEDTTDLDNKAVTYNDDVDDCDIKEEIKEELAMIFCEISDSSPGFDLSALSLTSAEHMGSEHNDAAYSTPSKKRSGEPCKKGCSRSSKKQRKNVQPVVFETWDDVADWPVKTCEMCFTGDAGMARKHRMTRLLDIAIWAPQSDFSGRACAETSCRMQAVANAASAGLVMKTSPAWSECDPAPHPMQRWRTSVRHRPLHYFSSILKQLSPRHQTVFASMLPDYDKDSPEVILAAHSNIKDYFLKHKKTIWPKHRKAYCEEHKKMCCVFGPCHDSEGQQLLALPIVGSDCTPWSSQGSRSGWMHEAIPRFWVVLSKLVSGNYSVFALENSGSGFPTDEIRGIVHAEGFGSNAAVVCPTQSGFPAVRSDVSNNKINKNVISIQIIEVH